MLKRFAIAILIVFLLPVCVYAKGSKNIEIFDANSNVVKYVESNSIIQNITKSYLTSIDGICAKSSPIPDNGYVMRIPLDHPIKVSGKWLNSFVDEVIVLCPKNEEPFLIVFENTDKLICLTFKGDVKELKKILKIKD